MNGHLWSNEDKAKLRKAFKAGGIDAARDAFPNRSVTAIERQLYRCGFTMLRKNVHCRWSTAEIAQLKALHKEGARPAQIARELKRAVSSVAKKLRTLSVAPAPKPEPVRDAARIKQAEHLMLYGKLVNQPARSKCD